MSISMRYRIVFFFSSFSDVTVSINESPKISFNNYDVFIIVIYI